MDRRLVPFFKRIVLFALCLEKCCLPNLRHFETKHERIFKYNADKAESIQHAVTRYGKQANALKVFVTTKNHATEASYRIAHCIAKHGKPFTDREYFELFSVAPMPCSKVCQTKYKVKNNGHSHVSKKCPATH